jgi:hypothetical protein
MIYSDLLGTHHQFRSFPSISTHTTPGRACLSALGRRRWFHNNERHVLHQYRSIRCLSRANTIHKTNVGCSTGRKFRFTRHGHIHECRKRRELFRRQIFQFTNIIDRLMQIPRYIHTAQMTRGREQHSRENPCRPECRRVRDP